jgi:hypothetical protein
MKSLKTIWVCQYKGAPIEDVDFPQCSGQPTHRIRRYFINGNDMLLCTAHAKWLASINPSHKIEKNETIEVRL